MAFEAFVEFEERDVFFHGKFANKGICWGREFGRGNVQGDGLIFGKGQIVPHGGKEVFHENEREGRKRQERYQNIEVREDRVGGWTRRSLKKRGFRRRNDILRRQRIGEERHAARAPNLG